MKTTDRDFKELAVATESPVAVTLGGMAMFVLIVLIWAMTASTPAYAETWSWSSLPPGENNGPCEGSFYWIEANGSTAKATLSERAPAAGCWIGISSDRSQWCWVHAMPGAGQVHSGSSDCAGCPSNESSSMGRGCVTRTLGQQDWHWVVTSP